MAQNWYFGGALLDVGTTAPYVPATFKGSWDSTSSVDDRILSPYQIGTTEASIASESSATNPFRVCVVRGVSPPLAAQSLSGTIDIVLGLAESNAAADFYTKIYAYITQGDSDLVRGVVVDWTESAGGGGTEWPTTATGQALQSAQSVGAVSVQEGDRLVVEMGYSSENSSTTSRTGRVWVGARGTDLTLQSDLTVGSTNTTTEAGAVVFSATINLSSTVPANLTPETAIEMTPLPYNSGANDPQSATYALWWKRTVTGSENGLLGTFVGVGAGGGTYTPVGQVRQASGSTFPVVGTGYNAAFQAYTVDLDAVTVLYLEVYSSDLTNPPSRDVIVSAIAAPTLPADPNDYIGDYLISEDDSAGVPFAVLVQQGTGTIRGFVDIVTSENGVVADSGVFVFTDKDVLSPTENQPIIYDLDFAVIAAVTGATVPQSAGGSGNVPVATDGTNFYCAQAQTGLGPAILVSKFDQAGTVLQQWTIPLPVTWFRVSTIGVSRDGLTLYYTDWDEAFLLGEPIKRWDLDADAPLSDFYTPTPTSFIKDIYVLRDDSILFNQVETALGTVYRYDAAGMQLNDYNFSDPFSPSSGVWVVDHIAPTQSDPASFGVWFQQENATYSTYKDYIFQKIQADDGTVLETISQSAIYDNEDALLLPEVDAEDSLYYFGAPNSCPLVILGARVGTGSITVVKVTQPTGASATFGFTSTGLTPSTFTLQDGDEEVFADLPPGTYGIAEDTIPAGWSLTSIVVSNESPADAITLGDAEDVTVTVTNTEVPTVIIDPIRRLRRAPHLSTEQMWQFFSYLQLDIQAGVGLNDGQGSDPQLMLRWSDDGGFTWSNEHWVSAGKIGQYARRAIWRRLGRGRDRVFEVTMTDPVLWVILDAFLQVKKGSS